MSLMLALMPVLVLLAFRTLCTLTPPPVPAYRWLSKQVVDDPRNGCAPRC